MGEGPFDEVGGKVALRAWLALIPWVPRYQLHRALGWPKTMPVNVTVSITNMCNSRCRTCFVWRLYRERPGLRDEEFSTEEFERTFESLGKQVVWVTISGGEPYLRSDLPRICEALSEHCSPSIINIPTNGSLPAAIESKTREVLQRCPDVTVIVNISLDGIGDEHDNIRGLDGNFERLVESYERLVKLKKEFPCLRVGIHSVISTHNIDDVLNVYQYARQLDPDSYITEVAEHRTELFNLKEDITPCSDAYVKVVDELSRRIRRDHPRPRGSIARITQALRLTYYQIASRELQERRQVVPCYAGFASCQITPYGDVWPCCVLGYERPMGNLREAGYDFKKVWLSRKADEVREYIRDGNCACPLANAHYTSILCSPMTLINVLKNLWW